MKRWWHRYFRTPGELREMGVVGINMRNAIFVLPNNPRRLYGRVDDKIETKRLAEEREIAVPVTYGVVADNRDIKRLERKIEQWTSFVIKPARGSGGKGVLVIVSREDGYFVKPSGVRLSPEDVRNHLSNILAGLFSLGGRRDVALIEQRVNAAAMLTAISFQGAPDIRIVLFRGYPVLAMLRASTRESDGRSNLHQGAIGVGIDIATGRSVRAIHHGRPITMHPDLKVPLLGIQMPEWDKILDIAATCFEMTGLGYLGIDIMVDEERGPLMIEVNARPGLAIQMANGVGLLKRLLPIAERFRKHPAEDAADKIAWSRKTFAARESGV